MPSILPHSVPRAISLPVARAVARTGLTPNQITLLGFLASVAAAVLVGYGLFILGAVVMLFGGVLDLIDGALARLTGQATAFGSVFDAVMDRYAEGAVLFGLLIWELNHRNAVEAALVFATVAGSFLVSYTRARAEVIRMDVKEGLFTRTERVALLALALLLSAAPHVLVLALWCLAILTNVTAIQRLYYVWTRTRDLPPVSAD
jgi:CDP-diacylglycerol--glycerol-3-phosphate 3-phosphatidyltransferase